MDELIRSIKAHLYERTTSPLFGAFVASWAVWNYKFIVVLFSSLSARQKFLFIDNELYPEAGNWLLTGLLWPLVTSIIFIFVYPYPAKFVYQFVRIRRNELLKIRQKIEDEEPLTQEQARELRRKYTALELAYDKELESERDQNQRLKELVNEYENQATEIDHSAPDPDVVSSIKARKRESDIESLPDSQMIILSMISEHDEIAKSSILARSGVDRTQTLYGLGELVNYDLVHEQGQSDGDSEYTITHTGRGILIANTDRLDNLRDQNEKSKELETAYWDFDRSGMRFEIMVDDDVWRCFISEESLEDNFSETADSDISGKELFESHKMMIRDIASRLIRRGDVLKGEELLLASDNVRQLIEARRT